MNLIVIHKCPVTYILIVNWNSIIEHVASFIVHIVVCNFCNKSFRVDRVLFICMQGCAQMVEEYTKSEVCAHIDKLPGRSLQSTFCSVT